MFFLQTQEYFLRLFLHLLAFSFSEKFRYFVFGLPWTPFFSPLSPKQPHFQANISSINLVSKQIYHRIDGILLASSKFGQSYKEDLSQSETAKYFEWIIIATIGLTAIGIYILPNHKSFNLRRNCQKNSLYFGKQLHMYFASRYGLLKFFRLQCFKI